MFFRKLVFRTYNYEIANFNFRNKLNIGPQESTHMTEKYYRHRKKVTYGKIHFRNKIRMERLRCLCGMNAFGLN